MAPGDGLLLYLKPDTITEFKVTVVDPSDGEVQIRTSGEHYHDSILVSFSRYGNVTIEAPGYVTQTFENMYDDFLTVTLLPAYVKTLNINGNSYRIKDEEARSSIETISGEIVTELSGLSDVSISSPTQGENLTYDSTLGKWKNTATSATVAWGGITGTLSDQTDLKNILDDKANKFSVTNPQLTSTDGICTWTITNTIGSKNVQVDVQEVSTGKFVLCNVDSSSSLIHVYLIGDSTVPSGTYEATIIG